MVRLFALILCGSLLACESVPVDKDAASRPMRKAPPTSAELPEGTLYTTARASAFTDMMRELEKADVVYVGEVHTDEQHHLVQLRVIEYLYAAGRLHGIGMEMFQRTFQPALDDYVFGRIDEAEMLKRTEWDKRWRFPITLYRPIWEFAREKRVPIIALNVESELRSVISKEGIDALTEEQRATLPAIDTSNEEHRAYLWRIYSQHVPEGKEPDMERFERFYFIMCLWDDVMADSIVRWFRTAPDDAQMVVCVGGGHVKDRYGIPDRAFARNGKTYKTVIPFTETEKSRVDPGAFALSHADFVWVVKAPAAAPAEQ